jgi:hypothetical protein
VKDAVGGGKCRGGDGIQPTHQIGDHRFGERLTKMVRLASGHFRAHRPAGSGSNAVSGVVTNVDGAVKKHENTEKKRETDTGATKPFVRISHG